MFDGFSVLFGLILCCLYLMPASDSVEGTRISSLTAAASRSGFYYLRLITSALAFLRATPKLLTELWLDEAIFSTLRGVGYVI